MAYSTKVDILQVLSQRDLAQLTDDLDNNSVNTAIVNTAISKADNQIDTYIRGKNGIPFTTPPPRVVDWSVTLAIFNLYKRRVDLDIPEATRIDYDGVIDELKGVRDGKILLDDSASVANTATFYKGTGSTENQIWESNISGTGNLDSYFNGPV